MKAATKILSISHSGKHETMDILSNLLCMCNQYKAALQLLYYMTGQGISDRRYIAQCHYILGEYTSAVDIIQADHKNSERYHGILGRVYMKM